MIASMEDPPDREVLLFNQALQLPASERAGYLNASCGDDRGLRRRIFALIESHEQAGAFLQEPPEAASAASAGRGQKKWTGTETNAPRLRQKRAAITSAATSCSSKSAKAAAASFTWPNRRSRCAAASRSRSSSSAWTRRQVIARFEAERQALAMMDHPNIAKVFDAGATDDRPALLRHGTGARRRSITEYCDAEQTLDRGAARSCSSRSARRFSTRIKRASSTATSSRRTFWCTVNDGVPVPKVIDFGIAKATAGPADRPDALHRVRAIHRHAGLHESGAGGDERAWTVDTRSDIYSLGVLLYELLTGQTPFDAEGTARRGSG